MEFFSVKLLAYSVQTANLLQRELTIDSFWNMYRKPTVQNRIKRKKSFFFFVKKIYGRPAS